MGIIYNYLPYCGPISPAYNCLNLPELGSISNLVFILTKIVLDDMNYFVT